MAGFLQAGNGSGAGRERSYDRSASLLNLLLLLLLLMLSQDRRGDVLRDDTSRRQVGDALCKGEYFF